MSAFPPPNLKLLVAEGKTGSIPFPILLNRLRDEAGVSRYTVDISQQPHRTIYYGKEGESWEEDHQPQHDQQNSLKVSVSPQLDEAAAIKALRRRQHNETSYEQFCSEIAAAGISHYEVNMNRRDVSYFGVQPGEKYVEAVPVINKE